MQNKNNKITETAKLILKIINAALFNSELHIETKSVDWDYLLDAVRKQRIYLLCYPVLASYIPDNKKAEAKAKYLNMRKIIDIQVKAIKEISQTQLKQYNTLFLKGVVLSELLYGSLYVRDPGDIDLLINPNELDDVKERLNKIGFLRSYCCLEKESETIRILEPTSNQVGVFHEQVFSKIVEDIEIFLEVKFYTSAVKERYIHFLWDSISVINVNGCHVNTTSLLLTFFHLCVNTYNNSERRFNIQDNHLRIRDYVDTYYFVKKYGSQIDWEELSRIANQTETLHKLRCVFNNLNELWGDVIIEKQKKLFTRECERYTINTSETGSVVDWKTPILCRMFAEKDAVKEYWRLYLKRMHSERNMYWNNKVVLSAKSSALFSMTCAANSDFSFEYYFWKEKEKIHIVLKLNKQTFMKFSSRNIRIDFNFFNDYDSCRFDDGCIAKVLQIFLNNETICTEIPQFPHTNQEMSAAIHETIIESELLERGGEIYVDVAVGMDFFTTGAVDQLLPYNIFVFETLIEGTIPVLIGVAFSETEDPEETTDMSILQM